MPITDKFLQSISVSIWHWEMTMKPGGACAYSIALRIFLSKESGCRTFFEKKCNRVYQKKSVGYISCFFQG